MGRRAVLAVKAAIWIVALVPLAVLVHAALTDGLGANPIEAVTHRTGDMALRLLLVTLAVTPVRRLTGLNALVKVRRLLGLMTFFWAMLHLSTYVVLDHWFDWGAMVADVAKRPYITAGAAALLLLAVLALTSTRGWIRRLGRRWQTLHRLVYLAGALAVLHFFWLVKADHRAPLAYGAVLLALLGFRVWAAARRRQLRRRAPVRRRDAAASSDEAA